MSGASRARPTRRQVLAGGLAAGLALAAGSALLAACQSPAQSSGGQPAVVPKVTPGATLQWMYWATQGPWLAANQKEAAAFETQYAAEGLKVAQLNVPAGQPFLDKLTAMTAGGTPPHVAEIMPWDVPQFQARGQLLNLSSFISRDKYDLSDFFAAGWDQYRYAPNGQPMGAAGAAGGGNLYGAPRDFPTRALAYDADAFKEIGATPPAATWQDTSWTWQAFLDAAQHLLKRDGTGPSGVGRWAWNGQQDVQQWLPWIYNNGGEFVSADGRQSLFDNPQTIEAFQFLADLQYRYKAAPTPAQQKAEGQLNNVFYAGRLAMTHFGPASIGAYRLGVKGFTWDVAVWPRTTGTGAAVGSGSGWVAPSAAANSEATWLFIQHLLSPTTQSTDAEAGSGVPVRMSTMQNVFVRQPAPPKNVQVFLENAKIARIVPQVPKWADMMTIVNRELNILWAGQTPARDVCLEIKRQVDAVLK